MSKEKADFSRREFLKTAGAVGLGSMLSPIDNMTHAKGLNAEKESQQNLVPTRPFGKTGVNISSLGLGLAMIPSTLLLKQAIKLGVTYWDTAERYSNGRSEAAIGNYFTRYPKDRKKVFLVTKSYRGIMPTALDHSLKRMNTTYIDLYMYHGISGIYYLDDNIRETVEKLKSEGKIKYFGFSTHGMMEDCLLAAAKLDWIDAIMMTYNYRLMHTNKMKSAVEACVNSGIGLVAMKTQAGRSYGPVGEETSSTKSLIERFSRKGFSVEHAKLKAVWESPNISSICSHMPNMKILMANAGAAMDRTNFSKDDKRLLEKYAQETRSNYCAGCASICESAIDNKVPISEIMRYLMYNRCYGEPERAKGAFNELPLKVRKHMAKIDYTKAEQKCPQDMKIGWLMRKAVSELA